MKATPARVKFLRSLMPKGRYVPLGSWTGQSPRQKMIDMLLRHQLCKRVAHTYQITEAGREWLRWNDPAGGARTDR